MVTVTNGKTGPAADKPAFWVDGNIHATEVAASAAGLYFLHTLVTQYGKDADVTRALDTRAFYICPRLNPDGAEWALADKPKWIRSSTRPYPYDEEDIEGLTVEDIDGDGRILQMRLPDANGLWKVHPDEPRLMIRREPTETGGTYYRLLPEGRVDGYDGFTLRVKKRPQGLDLNRNFPGSWRQEFEQMGAGPYPTSEPEVRAVVDFLTRHTNITGGTAFHTWSGVPAAPVRQPGRRRHAGRGPLGLPGHRQEGQRADRLSGHLRLSRLSLPPQVGHRRDVSVGVRAPRHPVLGGGDLGADARGRHRELQVHRLVPRPSARRRPEADPLERRETRRRRPCRLAAVRPPAAGQGRGGRLGPLQRLLQSTAAMPGARTRTVSEVAGLAMH